MTQPRLAQLHQSAALPGQAPVWDATAGLWVPANQAAGLDNAALFADRTYPPLGTYGYEFDRSYTTTLPSGFSWVNQGDGSFTEAADAAMLWAASTGGTTSTTETHRMIVRSFPSESEFSVELCAPALMGKQGTNTRGGLVIRDSGSGKYVTFGRVATDGNLGRVRVETWSALNTLDTVEDEALLATPPTHFRLEHYDATTWSFQAGAGGDYYSYMFDGATFDPTGLVASFDQIGFYAGTPNTLADGVGLDVKWLRFTP